MSRVSNPTHHLARCNQSLALSGVGKIRKVFDQRPLSVILRITTIFLEAERAVEPLENVQAPKTVCILKAFQNLGSFDLGVVIATICVPSEYFHRVGSVGSQAAILRQDNSKSFKKLTQILRSRSLAVRCSPACLLARSRSSIKIDLGWSLSSFREEALKSIQVDGNVYAFLVGHGMGPGQSASDVLRQALFHAIDIDDDLYAYLMSLASGAGETANAILRRANSTFTQIRRRSTHYRASSFTFPPGQGWTLEYTRPRGDGGGRTDAANRQRRQRPIIAYILTAFHSNIRPPIPRRAHSRISVARCL